VAVLGTTGTVESGSYLMEISKFFPHTIVSQEACPEWVSIVENNQIESPEADFFVKKHIDRVLNSDNKIDTLLLACTHYPLLLEVIKKHTPENISIISQGKIVAQSLQNYLKKHANINNLCSKNGKRQFFTTGNPTDFNNHASMFFGSEINANQLILR
jgi:glutamate racemase